MTDTMPIWRGLRYLVLISAIAAAIALPDWYALRLAILTLALSLVGVFVAAIYGRGPLTQTWGLSKKGVILTIIFWMGVIVVSVVLWRLIEARHIY